MARPKKEGIEYFPLDVNFYRNRKVRRVIRSQGEQSIGIWVVILSLIYEDKGYYVTFDENTCFDIADVCGVKEGAIEEFVKAAIKADLFNSYMFEKFDILTSQGIQDQYMDIIKKAKRLNTIEDKYNVSSVENEVNSEETQVNSEETSEKREESTQSKVKKNKTNKTKENKTTPTVNSASNTLGASFRFFENNGFGVLSGFITEKISARMEDFMSLGATEEEADQVVVKALEVAVSNGRTFWNYADGVLNRWHKQGLHTPKMIKADQAKQKNAKGGNSDDEQTYAGIF